MCGNGVHEAISDENLYTWIDVKPLHTLLEEAQDRFEANQVMASNLVTPILFF